MSAATPKVICHMLISLDGKVNGDMFTSPHIEGCSPAYYELDKQHFHQHTKTTLLGSVTVEENYSLLDINTLPPAAAAIPRTDFLADLPNGGRTVAVIDPRGRLAYKSNTIAKEEMEPMAGWRWLEILVEDLVSDTFLTHLRSINVPYIFAGKEALDCRLAVQKLAKIFNEDTLVLYGGGTINGTFLHDGLITELSYVVAPVVDGNPDDICVFYPSPRLPGGKVGVHNFELTHVEKIAGSGLWLRYAIKPSA